MHCLLPSIVSSDDLPRYCSLQLLLRPAFTQQSLRSTFCPPVMSFMLGQWRRQFLSLSQLSPPLPRPFKRRPTWQLRWNLELGSTAQFAEACFVTDFVDIAGLGTQRHGSAQPSYHHRNTRSRYSVEEFLPSYSSSHHFKSCLASWFVYKNHLYSLLCSLCCPGRHGGDNPKNGTKPDSVVCGRIFKNLRWMIKSKWQL